ncbi:alanyl-tRNA editing protein [Promethearchaeum syntrophicum]|uniref:Alanyl-tRNA editing protein n=1 Tax=Promethearchaeum syntrophicum TaxID=2594042 RepID=A0A5B9D9M3_9ARCH|nr:alanyl-tRNA editing protein [Candidatus Prometheoarchaeum syntrophicum]QEE15802.1 Alanyl-tRNA editing protein AlaX-M [Candidatus Prometheoarchaeum syntrophicum]
MTKILYLQDMNLKEFEGVVESVSEGKFIVINQTAFYPKSGGVDNDLGIFRRLSDNKEFKVIFVRKIENEIFHEVDELGLKTGDKILGILDWKRRFELMRYHTAAHVLSGVFFNEGNVKVTGNNLTMGKGRIDFNFPNFDRELVEKFVERSNEIISSDLSVETYYITRDEMEQDSTLMKLNMELPKNIKHVRIVDIKSFDKQPDGGCHVSHLGEIGKISIQKIQNKGKNNRRLYFKLEL